jgi:hypothetical protein
MKQAAVFTGPALPEEVHPLGSGVVPWSLKLPSGEERLGLGRWVTRPLLEQQSGGSDPASASLPDMRYDIDPESKDLGMYRPVN